MEVYMTKEFQIGIVLESDTEYVATKEEYHVYKKDTFEVCDGRYVALRAHDTDEFDVFLLIKGKKNITFDFCGATLVMHGKIQPFLIDSSENITVKNCKVVYDRPPYTEALILEATSEYARLRLNENCPCRIEDGRLIPYSSTWENRKLNHKGCFYQVFERETRKGAGIGLGVMGNTLVLDPNWGFFPRTYTAEADGEDIILKGEIPEYYKEDRILVIAHETRSLSGIFAIDSGNVTVKNYRIMSGWGMGFYAYRTQDITLDGFCLTYDDESPCLITNAADALHTFGTTGRLEIKNSVFEGMIDDAINIHSNFRTVDHVCENTIYTDLASCEKQAADLYRVGDEIAVYRGKTMEELARYTVEKIEKVSNTVQKFTVDRRVEEHQAGDLIENITANCDVLIENCIFGKANSHLRLQSRGKVIMRNCESELPVLLSGDASYWFESGPMTDLTVENCRFIGEYAKINIVSEIFPSEREPYYHRNLKIINNEFETDSPLQGGYADKIVFKGNRNSMGKPMTLTLTNCGSVDAEGCSVERKKEEKRKLRTT